MKLFLTSALWASMAVLSFFLLRKKAEPLLVSKEETSLTIENGKKRIKDAKVLEYLFSISARWKETQTSTPSKEAPLTLKK